MAVSKEEVEKIASLAKLKFTRSEIEQLIPQLNKILEYMNKLNELETDDIEPLSYPVESKGKLREDITGESIDRESALNGAPDQDGEFFRVPKVIKPS